MGTITEPERSTRAGSTSDRTSFGLAFGLLLTLGLWLSARHWLAAYLLFPAGLVAGTVWVWHRRRVGGVPMVLSRGFRLLLVCGFVRLAGRW